MAVMALITRSHFGSFFFFLHSWFGKPTGSYEGRFFERNEMDA